MIICSAIVEDFSSCPLARKILLRTITIRMTRRTIPAIAEKNHSDNQEGKMSQNMKSLKYPEIKMFCLQVQWPDDARWGLVLIAKCRAEKNSPRSPPPPPNPVITQQLSSRQSYCTAARDDSPAPDLLMIRWAVWPRCMQQHLVKTAV